MTGSAVAARQGASVGSSAAFFALTFAAAWSLWIAAAALADESWNTGVRQLLFLPGTFAPGIVAIWLTFRAHGAAGVGGLLGRLFVWRVHARWYVFALGYMAAAKLLAAAVFRVATGAWPGFGEVPLYLLVAAAIFSAPFQAGEEVGWRGFALPRLVQRFGVAPASVLLGVIWAVWHLPLFLLPATDISGQPFPVFLLSVTALSVAMAWLYACTRGSLLLVMLMHAAVNNTTGIVPAAAAAPTGLLTLSGPLVGWLTTAILWAGAAYFLIRMSRFDRTDPAWRLP